jgi:hypothetical protein
MSWGMWEVTLDPTTSTAHIVPLRTLEFTANVTQFMQPPIAKKNLLGISIDPATDFATGHVVVDVSFTHPFPGLDTYTGFDVRGVCIGNGSTSGVVDGAVLYAGYNDLRVQNADGMTRWFNPTEFSTYGTIFGFTLGKLGTPSTAFTATLNGYKYFCDGLAKDTDLAQFFADPLCTNPRGFFSAGNTITRTYDLQFPMPGGVPQISFQYAVVASWEPPIVQPPVLIPEDFMLSANCQEAYVITTADQSNMYWLSPSEKGGNLVLDVTVFDHQGVDDVGGVADEVGKIHLESQYGLIIGDLATFEGAALASALVESNAKYARYLLKVPEAETNPTSGGVYPILVIVETAGPLTYDSGVPGFVFPDTSFLSSYVIASITVGGVSTNIPPVALAELVGGISEIYKGQSLSFDGSASYDPDGTIVSWSWDSDDDGVYDDATGPTPTIKFPTGGVFHVDLQVKDNKNATDTLDNKITITVSDKIIYVHDANVSGPWDGSEDHPFMLIQDGINAVPDDTGWMVYVEAGIYVTPREDPTNSYSGGMVKIEGKHNMVLYGEKISATDRAVIDPPWYCLQNGMSAIRVRGGSGNITIDNFSIHPRYAYQSAIWCESIDGITVKNCTLEPPNESYGFLEFFRSAGCSNVLVKDNLMDTFNSASTYMSVFVISGGSNVIITGNNVYKYENWVGYNMYQTGEGYVAMYSVTGGEVSKNKFGAHARGCDSTNYVRSSCIEINGGSDITVRNNLIYDTWFSDSSAGQSQNWGILCSNTANAKIYNNTVDRVGPTTPAGGTGYTYGIWIQSGSVSEFHSNIVTDTQAPSGAQAIGILSGIALAIDYSDVYGVVGDGTSALYGGSAAPGTGYVSANPLYVNAAAPTYDYHLVAGSPCIATGKDGQDMGCYGGPDPLP